MIDPKNFRQAVADMREKQKAYHTSFGISTTPQQRSIRFQEKRAAEQNVDRMLAVMNEMDEGQTRMFGEES